MNPGRFDPVLRHIRRLLPQSAVEASDGDMLDRFVRRQEEAAFAGLVHKHGPLVRGVCGRVLGDKHAAEDAFQATFLVLARRAPAIRKRASLASYLYWVAYRVSLKARSRTVRQGSLEEQVGRGRPEAVSSDPTLSDLRTVLDEELNRLPEKFRAPLVLCYLEGKTKDEAAQELGWPEGTVSSRLARARDVLRDQLTRRGLAFSTTLFITLLSQTSSPGAVPAALATSTVHAALGFAAGRALDQLAMVPVATLVAGMLRDMALSKLKVVILTVAALVGLGGGSVIAYSWLPTAAPAHVAKDDNKDAKADDQLLAALKDNDLIFTAKIAKVEMRNQGGAFVLTLEDATTLRGRLPANLVFTIPAQKAKVSRMHLVTGDRVLILAKALQNAPVYAVQMSVPATEATLTDVKAALAVEKK
jgi:RNA polymerase sigma factor (sigma-70 family)